MKSEEINNVLNTKMENLEEKDKIMVQTKIIHQ